MKSTTSPNAALVEAVARAGSLQALAHETRVSESTVRVWLENGRAPGPAARLMAILAYSDPHHPKADALERKLTGR